MDDVTYGPADPYEDEFNPRVRQDWQIPKTDEEKDILQAVRPPSRSGEYYYANSWEKKEVQAIVRRMESLEDNVNAEMPTEWVWYCCDWATSKRQKKSMVGLKGLLTFINREEARVEWVENWKRDNEVGDSWEENEDDDRDW